MVQLLHFPMPIHESVGTKTPNGSDSVEGDSLTHLVFIIITNFGVKASASILSSEQRTISKTGYTWIPLFESLAANPSRQWEPDYSINVNSTVLEHATLRSP